MGARLCKESVQNVKCWRDLERQVGQEEPGAPERWHLCQGRASQLSSPPPTPLHKGKTVFLLGLSSAKIFLRWNWVLLLAPNFLDMERNRACLEAFPAYWTKWLCGRDGHPNHKLAVHGQVTLIDSWETTLNKLVSSQIIKVTITACTNSRW